MRTFRTPLLTFAALAFAVGLSLTATTAKAAAPTTCPFTFLCVDTSTGAMQFGPGAYAEDSPGFPNLAMGFNSGVFGRGTAVGANSSIDVTSMGSAFGGAYLNNGAVGVAMGTSAQINGNGVGITGVAIGDSSLVRTGPANAGQNPWGSVAIGPTANTNGYASIAIGNAAQAGLWGTADIGNISIGNQTYTSGTNDTALGTGAQVWGTGSNPADNSVAIGAGTVINESNVVGIGSRRLTQVGNGIHAFDAVNIGQLGTAIGYLGGGAGISGITGTWNPPTYVLNNGVYHDVGSALTGLQSEIGTGTGGSAPVWLATDAPTTSANQAGIDEVAVGPGASAGNADTGQNTAIGAGASAGTVGSGAAGTGGQATAVGAHAGADAVGGSSFGQGAYVGPDGIFSVAVGAQTTTDRAFTVAVGNRTLSQMLDGTELQDGVTVNQLNNAMVGFGAGASFIGGVYTPPTFILTAPGAAGTYTDTNGALLALDNGLNAVNSRIDNLPPSGSGSPGPVGPTGPQGPKGDPGAPGKDGKDGTGSGTDALAVHYDSTDKNKVTLAGANGTTISNVADGLANSDAANVGQVSQQVQDAINTANRYTDASSAQTLNWANAYTDRKFAEVNQRFSTTQAMSTASTQMVATFGGMDPNNHNRVAAGVGFAGGHNGIAVGYQHTSESGHVAWNVGGAAAGKDRTIGAGVGYSW